MFHSSKYKPNTIKKILIAEDIDSLNSGIAGFFGKQFEAEIKQSKYLDEALLQIKSAINNNRPFDLLITDLSFKSGPLPSKLLSGSDLIASARRVQPAIKAIVYSVEDKPIRLRSLIEHNQVDSYVLKGLNSMTELLRAVQQVDKGQRYFPAEVMHLLKSNDIFEIDDYHLFLLEILAKGLTVKEISSALESKGYKPYGESAIEKKINALKNHFKAKNSVHLIALAKDLGLV